MSDFNFIFPLIGIIAYLAVMVAYANIFGKPLNKSKSA